MYALRLKEFDVQGHGFAAQWVPTRAISESTSRLGWYFEVEILETGSRQPPVIGVGLSTLLRRDLMRSYPGWYKRSCGYHCDNAKIYNGRTGGEGQPTDGDPARKGDIIRCTIRYVDSARPGLDKYEIQFLHNDTKAETSLEVPGGDPVYPVVSLTNRGEKVRMKLVAPS